MIPAFVQRNLFVRRLQIWRLIFGVTQSTADVNDVFDTVRTSSAEEPEIQVCIVTFSNKAAPADTHPHPLCCHAARCHAAGEIVDKNAGCDLVRDFAYYLSFSLLPLLRSTSPVCLPLSQGS